MDVKVVADGLYVTSCLFMNSKKRVRVDDMANPLGVVLEI